MKANFTNICHINLVILCCIGSIFGMLNSIPSGWNESIENTSVDLLFKIRGSRPLDNNITVVFIGDEDIKAFNKDKGYPITRDYYGYLVYVLNQLGAKVIGIDVLFSTAARAYPEYDLILAKALGTAKNVCLTMTFSELTFDGERNNKLPKRVIK